MKRTPCKEYTATFQILRGQALVAISAPLKVITICWWQPAEEFLKTKLCRTELFWIAAGKTQHQCTFSIICLYHVELWNSSHELDRKVLHSENTSLLAFLWNITQEVKAWIAKYMDRLQSYWPPQPNCKSLLTCMFSPILKETQNPDRLPHGRGKGEIHSLQAQSRNALTFSYRWLSYKSGCAHSLGCQQLLGLRPASNPPPSATAEVLVATQSSEAWPVLPHLLQ